MPIVKSGPGLEGNSMAKKIILISSFPFLVTIVIIVTVLVGIGRGQPASTPANIDSARTNIISLADAGKLAETDAAVNKLAANYTDTTVLTINYYIIADSFAWRRMYDRANRLYQLVIDKSADSSLVIKARLGLARVEILGLIGEKKFSVAQEKLDLMIAYLDDEPNLPPALFQVGQEFIWQRRYSEAKDAFDHISPISELSQQAKLWSARSKVCSLIGKSADSEVIEATDKLISDFEGEAGLPEAIYWISKEYEWKKSAGEDRAGWYDAPNSAFQRLVYKFSDTSYGQEAEWDQKRLKHRMNIFKLMKEADQNAVDAEIEKMVADLSGRPEVASELYWIAFGYEEINNQEKAKRTYNRIIMNYPETPEADNAALDVRRLDIWKSFNDGDINQTSIQIDEFIDDFRSNPNINACLGSMAAKCCLAAIYHDKNKATIYFHQGKVIWEKLMDKAPSPEVAFYIGNAYKQMGDCNNAIPYLKRTIKEWPDYKLAWKADALLADCLEKEQ